MIPELEDEIRQRWAHLGMPGACPHRLSTMKLSTSDYPDPINAMLFLVFPDKEAQPCAVAKMARVLAGNASIEMEGRHLQQTLETLPADLGTVVPRVMQTGSFNQRSYVLMSTLPGRTELHHTWNTRRAAKTSARINAALLWALRMARASLGPSVGIQEWLRSDNAEQLVDRLPADSLEKKSRDLLVEALRNAWHTRWPSGWTHGDYFPGNVLFEGNAISGVVDWSLASAQRPFFFDILTYELSFTFQDIFGGNRPDANRYLQVAQLAPFRELRRILQNEFAVESGLGSVARMVTLLDWTQRALDDNATHHKVADAALRLLSLELQQSAASLSHQ